MSSFFGRNLGGNSTSTSATSSTFSSGVQGAKPVYYRSTELDRLLNSFGNLSTGTSNTNQYDAEVMIDELLASTWEARQRRSSSTGITPTTSTPTTPYTNRTKASMSDLQNVLSDAIEKLVKHRQVISERINTLEKDNQKAANKYPDTLKYPEQLLTHICTQMEDVEERFTKVSSTAVLIGQRLSSLDDERKRVLETEELMEALIALNDIATSRTTTPNNNISSTTTTAAKSHNRLVNILQDKHQLHEASRIIKKMSSTFSNELTSPLISNGVLEIERLCQTIENDLLTEFSEAQEKRKIQKMNQFALSLIEYKDKDKVADRYVWNVMKDQLAFSVNTNTEISVGSNVSLEPIQDMEVLFSKIYGICQEHFVLIHQVFPSSVCHSIRELLMERLFNDPAFGILSFLEQFLVQSQAQAEKYVQLLCAAYEKTCHLATSIEQLNIPRSNHQQQQQQQRRTASTIAASPSKRSMLSDAIELTESLADKEQLEEEELKERMHTFLNLQLHSLFGSHRPRYFRTEMDLCQKLNKELLNQVQFPHQLTIKQKQAAIKAAEKAAKAKEKNAAAVATSTTTTNNMTATSSENVLADVTSPTTSGTTSSAFVFTPEMSLVYYETLLFLAQDEDVPLKYATFLQDSVGRCDIILKETEMRSELVTRLFGVYCGSYADEYLGKLSLMSNEILQEPYLSPDSPRQFFTILTHVLRRIDFMEKQFEQIISKSQQDAPTQLTICYETKRKSLEKIEYQIANGLQFVFHAVEKHISYVLNALQEKNDFIGSEANMSLSSSRACRKVVEYMQPLVHTICQVLVEENRDRFLIALCTIFKELFLIHLQKFRFDPDGACMLLRDVNAYRQMFRTLRNGPIEDIFDILHEVANIFALPPENLAGFIRDGKLATMPKQTLTDILKRRWDYKTHADKYNI